MTVHRVPALLEPPIATWAEPWDPAGKPDAGAVLVMEDGNGERVEYGPIPIGMVGGTANVFSGAGNDLRTWLTPAMQDIVRRQVEARKARQEAGEPR